MSKEEKFNLENAANTPIVKDLISKLDMLYQDKFNGIVSEEMHLRISRKTENSLARTREKIENLQNTKENKKINKSELKITKIK